MEKFSDFKKFELKLEKILQKGKKYNLIDRFYYYLIKKNKIKNQIIKLDLSQDEYSEFTYFLFIGFESREYELKSKIIESYGLSNIKAYTNTKKATILNNPDLLGITPFLFRTNTNEWYDYLKNDIEKYGNYNFYDIERIILNCLNDSLNRLDLDSFTRINIYSRKIENFTPDGLFSLLVDDIFELIEKNDSIETTNQNKLVKNIAGIERIILDKYNTGNIVDTLIGSFKDVNALDDTQKKEIRKFVSMIFVNKTGKRLKHEEILNVEFIDGNIKHLKENLNSKAKFPLKNWTNKKLSELICAINPNHFKLKTIENY
jgi:hypothetical protein